MHFLVASPLALLSRAARPAAWRWLPVLALALPAFVHAQAWPTRPVRIIVPVAAGGTVDLVARTVGEALAKNLGQPFTVDVKAGAAGSIGATEVARAPADGYTLLLGGSSTLAVNPAVSSTLTYNAAEDFTPIALLGQTDVFLLVSSTLPVKNLQELLALARQKPGYLNYGSSGTGSIGHLAMAALGAQAGVSFTHVPYKGTAAVFTDLMAGRVHMLVEAVPSGVPRLKDERMRAIAVMGPARSPLIPNIPTVAESGLPGFTVQTWYGFVAPRGLPPELTARMNEEVNKALRSPEILARFATLGLEPGRGTPEQFSTMVAGERQRWTRLAKDLKIMVD